MITCRTSPLPAYIVRYPPAHVKPCVGGLLRFAGAATPPPRAARHLPLHRGGEGEREGACIFISPVLSCLRRQVGSTGGFLRNGVQKRGVRLMNNIELLNTIIAVAGLVFAAYVAGAQNRR